LKVIVLPSWSVTVFCILAKLYVLSDKYKPLTRNF
jgi:hypothetical protein